MDKRYSHIFEPIALRKKQARNRIMRVATNANMAERNRVTERQIDFYRTTVRNGVGTLVTEGLRGHPSARSGPGSLAPHDRNMIPSFRALADAMHGDGALIFGQLTHGGRQHHGTKVNTSWAPSAIACPKSGGIPHEMHVPFLVGMVVSAIVGALSIQFFLNFLRHRSLSLFVWYRIIFGIIVFALATFFRSNGR